MRIVGIAGADGCGKSTLAGHLLTTEGYYPVRVPFAEQLRHEVQALLEQDGEQTVDAWQKPTPAWLRQLLRGWGDYKRSLQPDYWVLAWRGLIQFWGTRHTPHELLIIADDLRYVNEAEAVHNLGGTVIYLDDVAVPDHQLLHELLDVREMADIGFTVDSRAGKWVDAGMVTETLGL